MDWSVGALGETEELQNVIEAIPGFLNSQKVKDLKKDLPDRSKFIKSLGQSLGRTLLSNSLSEQVKTRRVEICMNAANKICDSTEVRDILRRLSSLRFDGAPQTIQTAELLAGWCTGSEDEVSKARRKIVARILPTVQKRDDGWIAFAGDQLGVQEDVLRDNIARRDNGVLLAIVLHAMRSRTADGLSSLSRFDILNANPELQMEFCALWNELVLDSKEGAFSDQRSTAMPVLRKIRHLCIAPHQGTDSAPTQFSASTRSGHLVLRLASSYPSCNIKVAHHPISTVPAPTPSFLSRIARQAILALRCAPPRSRALQNTDPLLSVEAPHVSSRPSLPSTDLVARTVKPTPDIPTEKIGETSQTPAATSLTFAHIGPPLPVVTPPNVPAPHAASDIIISTNISSSAHHVLQSIPNISTSITPQAGDPEAIVLPTVLSDSHSPPVMMSTPRSGLILSVPPSSMESAPDYVEHQIGPTPSIPMVPQSQVTTHVSSVLDVQMEVSLHADQLRPSTHDIARDPV